MDSHWTKITGSKSQSWMTSYDLFWTLMTSGDFNWRDYYDKGNGIARSIGGLAGAQQIHLKPSCLDSDWLSKRRLWFVKTTSNATSWFDNHFWKQVKDCSQRCFNFRENFYFEPGIKSLSKNKKLIKLPTEELADDTDIDDAECQEITETECNFSSDASNCSDWLVSIIRKIFKI